MPLKPDCWSAILLALSIIGCHGSDDIGIVSPPHANMTGDWDVTLTVTAGGPPAPGTQIPATFAIAQKARVITGTVTTTSGVSGSLGGLVTGQEFDLTVDQTAPCAGSFTGTGSVNLMLTEIVGSYSGSDCNGTLSIDFVATR